MLIFVSKKTGLKPLKQSVRTEKKWTSDLEGCVIQPNAEQLFLGNQNVTINFQ